MQHFNGAVWSTPLGPPGDVAFACTNIQQVAGKEEEKGGTPLLTHGATRGFGLTSLVVCINNRSCDIRERNVTMRSEF